MIITCHIQVEDTCGAKPISSVHPKPLLHCKPFCVLSHELVEVSYELQLVYHMLKEKTNQIYTKLTSENMNILHTYPTIKSCIYRMMLQKEICKSINYDKIMLTVLVKMRTSACSTGMECTLPSTSHKEMCPTGGNAGNP